MPSSNHQQLIDIIAGYTDGAAISDLERHFDISRRSLQRRLRTLVQEGNVRREGKGRGTRYFADGHAKSGAEATALDEEQATQLLSEPTFSDDAKRARRRIQKPPTGRKPVSYQSSFLEAYKPGQTFYLSAETRQKLQRVGSVTERDLPAGTYARRILDRLLIDLSWNSSRLEGNTYSLLETERLLEAGIASKERDPQETQMILNHKSAIEYLVDSADDDQLRFGRRLILNLHALLSENLLNDPAAEGRLRRRPVRISGSVYEPLADPHRIEDHFSAIVVTADAIDDPFEQAFFTLVHLPYLQPFLDANKRSSRLAANIPFIRDNYSPLSFADVSTQHYVNAMLAIYEYNDVAILRDVFVWAYQRSAARYQAIRNSLGEPDPYRLRRRAEIKALVRRVIRQAMSRTEAAEHIDHEAEAMTADERQRFTDVVWEELDSLHEGNFARYRVRPSEFERWERGWEGAPDHR